MKITFYKIYLNTDDKEFYIGSTNNFKRRCFQHKKNVNNRVGKLYHNLLYRFIRDNGGWDNFTMEEIYSKEFENKTHWLLEEQCIINLKNPTLNNANPSKNKNIDLYEKIFIENFSDINE
jgi:hypothetical protein